MEMITFIPWRRYPRTLSISLANFFAFWGQTSRQLAAVDTVILHDVGLLILHGDRLHLTVPHTFIAVTAACILKNL